jgi:hypothetical protein
LFGLARLNAQPSLWFSPAALLPLIGFKAQQVRHGGCQRGAVTQPAARPVGPSGVASLAKPLVRLNVQELDAWDTVAIRALATAEGFGAQGMGLVDGTDLETTERYTGCGQVTRHARLEDQPRRGHEIEVAVDGWHVLRLIDPDTPMPLAVQVGPMDAHETPWTWAVVIQARAHLAGAARLDQVICAQGCLTGTALGWLDPHDLLWVVPARDHRAVTVEAWAHAAARERKSACAPAPRSCR